MILATWNVNSIRARMERVVAWIEAKRPDVLCMQELKAEESQLELEPFARLGYSTVFAAQKTYNGVAILSREPLRDVRIGMEDGVEDPQARRIGGEIGGVRIINVYVPNGQTVGSEKYEYKLQWMGRFRRFLDEKCRQGEKLIVCGDFNVAPENGDVHDPIAWAKETLFHVQAREALEKIRQWGLVDLFRLHHHEPGYYSWWDYQMLAFPKNRGLRIDHIFASEAMARRCTGCVIDREARKGQRPSDHAPVIATFA